MKTLRLLLSFIIPALIMASCEKTDLSSGPIPVPPDDGGLPSRSYSVRLTDAPGVYGAVYIDLKGVEVTCSNGKVFQLNTSVGRYNLRTLTNGKDTLIATGKVVGNVTKVRLILGGVNHVVSACITYGLTLSGPDEAGLTVPINRVGSSKSSALLDFDANQSIIDMGNNEFRLKPVIRSIEPATSGCIKGTVTPFGCFCSITATNMFRSYSTFVDEPNEFLLMGLPAGKYSVTVVPNLPGIPVTFDNIDVNTGATTDMGTIKF